MTLKQRLECTRRRYTDYGPVGHYAGPYGDVLNSLSVYQRHATDVVSAINFDYRGFDTPCAC